MEGPPLKAIADKLRVLEGRRIREVSGNTKTDKERLRGETIERVYTVGKRLVLETNSAGAVFHFLMFGSYRLNERKEGAAPRLSLALDGNELNFYNCSVKILTKEELAALDPTSDILNPLFDGKRALAALRSYKGIVADVLLDQDIFFSDQFYEVEKRDGLLKPIFHVYYKSTCELCHSPIRRKKMGEKKRMSFFSPKRPDNLLTYPNESWSYAFSSFADS